MSTPLPTLITSALLLALQVTLVLCLLVDWRYRAAVLRLMRLAPGPGHIDAADSADRIRWDGCSTMWCSAGG